MKEKYPNGEKNGAEHEEIRQKEVHEGGEMAGEIMSFEEGVARIVAKIFTLFQSRDLVTFSVYGPPNSGKSEFATQVMKNIWAKDETVRGGEVKGYDELPSWRNTLSAKKKGVMLIQHPYWPGERATEEVIIRMDAKNNEMPMPEEVLVLCGKNVDTTQITFFTTQGYVVIKNPSARRK